MQKIANNLKQIVSHIIISGILLSIFWFNVDILNKLFFDIRCESFGCIGLGVYYLVEYIVVLILILLIEIIVLWRTVEESRLKVVLVAVSLTIVIAICILVVDDFMSRKNEVKVRQDAYYECLDFAKQDNISEDYCGIYK